MAGPRRKRTVNKKSLGSEGKRVRQQIIDGHNKEIEKLKIKLEKTEDPTQKQFLQRQIRKEVIAITRFKQQTK